jgi:hypothetical protein
MEKYLVKGEIRPSKKVGSKPVQKRLSQCKKVVKLKASNYVICFEELESLKRILESSASTSEVLLRSLRHLDALILHSGDLIQSQVGRSVKPLRKNDDLEVSTLAGKLIEKWRAIVLKETVS